MNKYLLLVVLNLPFIVYGLFKTIIYFKEKIYSRNQLITRSFFWVGCLVLIVFAKPIYDFALAKRPGEALPLSGVDVVLVTLCFLLLTLIIRVYARLERVEKKFTEFNEALALKDK